MNLDGKVAIITGAGGLATDEALFGAHPGVVELPAAAVHFAGRSGLANLGRTASPWAVCSHALQ
jgi:hypothetical protein